MEKKSYYSIYKKLLILIAVLIFYLGTSFSRGIYSSGTADDIIYLIIIFTISLFCNVNAMLVAGEQMCKEKEELNRIQITAYTDNEKEEYKNIPNADTAFQETFSRETEYQRDLVYTEIKSAKTTLRKRFYIENKKEGVIRKMKKIRKKAVWIHTALSRYPERRT